MSKKILVGLIENPDALYGLQLIQSLEEEDYQVSILKTKEAENLVPFYFWDKYFVTEGSFDLCIVFPFDGSKNLEDDNELRLFIQKENLDFFPMSKDDFVNKMNYLVPQIESRFKKFNLEGYSFLVTTGTFVTNLDSQHYIGCYNRQPLIEEITKAIALQGGFLTIIAHKNQGDFPYGDEVIYVENKEEFESVLQAKSFKYDIIIDGGKIPRFKLADGEKVHVEYQRYFAEFEESYLPFKDVDLISENQVILRFFDGYEMPSETIDYYFENTGIHGILCNEIDEVTGGYRGFSKLYTREHSLRVVSYRTLEELGGAVVRESITMLEGR